MKKLIIKIFNNIDYFMEDTMIGQILRFLGFIFTIIILLSLIFKQAKCQEYYIENGIEMVKMKATIWENTRDGKIKYYNLSCLKDTMIIKYDSAIVMFMNIHKRDSTMLHRDSLMLQRKDSINSLFVSELTDCENKFEKALQISGTQNTSFFEYQGAFIGLNLGYRFADSILTKLTVLNGMQYNIYFKFRFVINKNLEIEPQLQFPLRSEKFGIFFNLGYKIF